MKLPTAVVPFWEGFLARNSANVQSRLLGADYFGDNKKDANELAQLVLSGVKTGTAPLLWSYEFDGQPVPQPGSLLVVINWRGEPQCVVETTRVDVVPYRAVSAEFAAIEGEGDGSLQHWRQVHWPYYERECLRVGKTPDQDMPVICEQFTRVYP